MTAGLATFPSRRIPLVDVRRDGGTQVRETMNAATAEEYAAALAEGEVFPPVTVFFDGAVYWLADGFHRVLAHEKAGLADVLAEVRRGTKRDALLFAVGANASHGLPRTNKDKRRAVEILLRDEEWSAGYDTTVAKMANVSSHFVGVVRKELVAAGDIDRINIRQGTNGTTRDTSKSGRKTKPAPAEPTPSPEPPAQPTRHPLLDELDAARDRDALDSAYSKVSLAGFVGDEAEEAGRVYQRRVAEFRAQAATTAAPAPTAPPSQPAPVSTPAPSQPKQADLFTDAPVHVSTQAPAPQPEKAAVVESVPTDTVTIPRAEYEAMCAELGGLRQWQQSTAARAGADDQSGVSKVMRLIALASSPNENEAKSAAYQACRIIRERGLLVATAVHAPQTGEDADKLFESLRQEQAEFWARMNRRADEIFGAKVGK